MTVKKISYTTLRIYNDDYYYMGKPIVRKKTEDFSNSDNGC